MVIKYCFIITCAELLKFWNQSSPGNGNWVSKINKATQFFSIEEVQEAMDKAQFNRPVEVFSIDCDNLDEGIYNRLLFKCLIENVELVGRYKPREKVILR